MTGNAEGFINLNNTEQNHVRHHSPGRHPSGDRLGTMSMAVTALEPDAAVRWHCPAGPDEWIGSDLEFLLSQEGEHSIVRFGHRNWREAVDFTAHCSTKWASFLLSLKALLETGQGRPSPRDVKIDNWN